MSFANRAAVFFETQKYDDAIYDINAALMEGYPDSRRHLLLIRKLKCLKVTGKSKELKKFSREVISWVQKNVMGVAGNRYLDEISRILSGNVDISPCSTSSHRFQRPVLKEPNKMLLGASSSIQIDIDPIKGRKVIASKKISEGDIILVEDALVWHLYMRHYNSYCQHCLVKLTGRFLACPKCVAVKFCSEKCLGEGLEKYHGVECPFVPVLKKMGKGILPLRLALHFGLENVISCNSWINPDISLVNWWNTSLSHDADSVASLCCESNFSFHDLFLHTIHSVILMRFLTVSNDELRTEDQQHLATFLLKSYLQITINSYENIDSDVYRHPRFPLAVFPDSISDLNKVGSSLYVTASMFNHCCYENTQTFPFNNTMILVANKNIEPQEEITINYALRLKENTKKDRREFIKKQFGFVCICNHCVDGTDDYQLMCPSCKMGRLVLNLDGTNHCIDCLMKNQILDDILRQIEIAERFLVMADHFKDMGYLEMAEKYAIQNDMICNKVYLPSAQVRLNGKHLLARIYELQNKIILAINCLEEVVMNVELCYGKNSSFTLFTYMKLAELYFKRVRFNNAKIMRKYKFYALKCVVILSQIHEMELKLVEKYESVIFEQCKRMTDEFSMLLCGNHLVTSDF